MGFYIYKNKKVAEIPYDFSDSYKFANTKNLTYGQGQKVFKNVENVDKKIQKGKNFEKVVKNRNVDKTSRNVKKVEKFSETMLLNFFMKTTNIVDKSKKKNNFKRFLKSKLIPK